ncbi:MAG: NAD-dependent epimerase/dehydratase family protein [Myxococcales bacterium]|nr:NAD-dependent epimerase/dehydratase family protein [Myxococcales bacterium]
MTSKIAILGSEGFVGSSLCAALSSSEHEIVPVTRDSFAAAGAAGPYDIVINAACPGRRFWAEQNPAADFEETVVKTARILHTWRLGKLVQISSMSARAQLDTAYGRHRAAAEALCVPDRDLVVRLGPMYGDHTHKGSLFDMLRHDPVFASGESRQSFAPVRWCGEWVAANLTQVGLREVGARTWITLRQVRDALDSRSEFVKETVDDQFPSVGMVGEDWPRAEDVIPWLRERAEQRSS